MIIYLNLLPKEERKKIELNSIYRFVLREGIFLIVLMACIAIGAWQVRARLEQTIAGINTALGERKEKNKPLSKKVEVLNQTIDQIAKIQSGYSRKSKIIIDFVKLVPRAITITDFSLSEADAVSIDGVYKNREDLLRFKTSLDGQFLINMQFPISNLLKQENGAFSIRGNLSPDERTQGAL